MKIAVHMHIYYYDMLDYLLSYVKNLNHLDYDLYVTHSKNGLQKNKEEIAKKIKQFKEGAKVVELENKGYDIGPFIYFLHDIDLKEYDIIYKVHTKNTTRGKVSKAWGDAMLNSILGSKEIVNSINKSLVNKNNNVGMVGSSYCIYKGLRGIFHIDKYAFYKTLYFFYKRNLVIKSNYKFIAGTMFATKASLMKFIKDNIKFDDFETLKQYKPDGTFAHAVERVLGFSVYEQGYCIDFFDKDTNMQLERLMKKKKSFSSKLFKMTRNFIFFPINFTITNFIYIAVFTCNTKSRIYNLLKKQTINKNHQ